MIGSTCVLSYTSMFLDQLKDEGSYKRGDFSKYSLLRTVGFVFCPFRKNKTSKKFRRQTLEESCSQFWIDMLQGIFKKSILTFPEMFSPRKIRKVRERKGNPSTRSLMRYLRVMRDFVLLPFGWKLNFLELCSVVQRWVTSYLLLLLFGSKMVIIQKARGSNTVMRQLWLARKGIRTKRIILPGKGIAESRTWHGKDGANNCSLLRAAIFQLSLFKRWGFSPRERREGTYSVYLE